VKAFKHILQATPDWSGIQAMSEFAEQTETHSKQTLLAFFLPGIHLCSEATQSPQKTNPHLRKKKKINENKSTGNFILLPKADYA